MTRVARILVVGLLFLAAGAGRAIGQDDLVERPPPPRLDDFETDANGDGVPDGWYNACDATIVAEGGKVGPHLLKLETRRPGRLARISRAFGVDGKKTEAIVIGLWVRANQVQTGERLGYDPALIIDFIGDGLRTLRRGTMGPWTKSIGPRWTRVSKRFPVPPGTNEAIMSVGLLGATGVLEIDGMTIDPDPVGATETTNLVLNGDFELGDPTPFGWLSNKGARRIFPGFQSESAIELPHSGSRVLTGLSIPVEPFTQLDVSVMARGQGLRGAGGAGANIFFIDDDGRPLRGISGGVSLFRWSSSFDWQPSRGVARVPQGAVRAVLQFEKAESSGVLRLDDVTVTASPNAAAGAWIPDHVEDDTTGWIAVTPSKQIEPASALDASFLLDAPAGKHGFVTVRDGRLHFSKGGRARFFGVYPLAPAAFPDRAHADRLADRLARSGINLVRLGDLDTPIGPDLSLYDDSRDDTKAFDPAALARLDHLIAALKARGIYIAIELQTARRFRSEDGVDEATFLPPGGGPAAEFDPVIGKLALDSAKALLAHVNPETGLALRDDPVLAWVTLTGENTLFDQIDDPDSLPHDYAVALRTLVAKSSVGSGRRAWQAIGSAHWKAMADALRNPKVGLRVPVAGVSHWRREADFSAAQAGAGLDLIDDRLYWQAPSWQGPAHRSLLWSDNGALIAGASAKRRVDRPYVVGQWCHQTMGAWALAYEAADLMLAAEIAASEDWDALVRRGVFVYPDLWGASATGTGGHEDIFQVPEAVNGIPVVYALWPHAASLMLRPRPTQAAPARAGSRNRAPSVPGWEPNRGRLAIDTPYTQGLAGWPNDQPANFEEIQVATDNPYAVVVASSATSKPIATTSRLLVTAVARVQPTGFRWTDEWRREVADPGRSPLIQEPVRAKVFWRRKGNVKAYPLDNNGIRGPAVRLEVTSDGVRLAIPGTTSTMHWELVVE